MVRARCALDNDPELRRHYLSTAMQGDSLLLTEGKRTQLDRFVTFRVRATRETNRKDAPVRLQWPIEEHGFEQLG